jgi:hypothetical protein
MQLVHPELDNDLGSSWRSGFVITPGATNSVFATNAAPNIRQVRHTPGTPASTNSVVITARITDPHGVASAQLHVQFVAPGAFIPSTLPLNRSQLDSLTTNPALTNALNPAFENATNWTTLAMHDDGLNGDAVAGDDTYSAVVPQQANRTLVRYRITTTDSLGRSRRAPFEDDPSLNFAYFVYNGIPGLPGFFFRVPANASHLHLDHALFGHGPVRRLVQRERSTRADGRVRPQRRPLSL